MRCPRCGPEGTVLSARIHSTGEIVHLCDECDALWPSGVPVAVKSHVDFATYVEPYGLKALWSEIEILPSET